MNNNQVVLVLDFGGQYKELIARRVRECKVLSLIKPGSIDIDEIVKLNPIGIILTGGPNSVYNENSPKCSKKLFELGIPVLGICYGMQLITYTLGGKVSSCKVSEYGKTDCQILTQNSKLFSNLEKNQSVLMSHTDKVTKLPEGFVSTAKTVDTENAAIECEKLKIYATQFHPEVTSTKNGKKIIKNFLYNVCGAIGDYNIGDYEKRMIEKIKAEVGNKKVILALSGGVDSSVCAALLAKAVPNQVTCIFVDHGMMRKNESDEIQAVFEKRELNFIRVNAENRFLTKLNGVTEPEKKRKIIGEEFIRVFEDESKKIEDATCLAQGTIYPDVVESGANKSATIKSHHNVGGLPKDMRFTTLVEPLRGLFKDEVRALGRRLGLTPQLVNRQPFPGPGLAVRVVGELTRDKLDLLREADAIFREELETRKIKADQYFAVLTDTRSVGVVGDFRSYGYTIALRAVLTTDFMTCEYAPISHKILAIIANRIVNNVKGVSRVVYDITGKPPATIEWE